MKKFTFILFVALSCAAPLKEASQEQIKGWEEWKETRIKNLKAPSGFLNLAGLYWLKQGENTFGSDSSNDIIFPSGMPGTIGILNWMSNQVNVFQLIEGVSIDSIYQEEGIVYDADSAFVGKMELGFYQWYIIERAGNIGIRLKDLDHIKLKETINIHFYDFNPELVVQADFVSYPVPKKLRMDNVLGHQFEMEISGQLRFKIGSQSFTMEPMDAGDDLFIIFSDETSAIETYGSGRYMYAKKPKPGEKVTIDFNRSYNPPCAFSDFATCLIPPPENQLTVRIDAGELDYHM